MKKWQMIGLAALTTGGIALGVTQGAETGLTSWKSGKNHNRIIQIQNEGGTREAV